MNDPWWLVLIKVVVLFVVLLVWTIFNVWFERRLVGKMQHRLGPIMNGPFGLGQALADGMKLLIKEDFMPSMVDRVLFTLAPLIAGVAAFTAWAVIPFGGEVEIFGVTTRLQLADPSVGVLVLLAVTSVGIYGFVLAGWSSNSPYSLLGGLRSSAQMISYEIAMGLSFVAVFLYSGSMSTSEIITAQEPIWFAVILLPSFIIYVTSMVGETNRAPFDLPEAEGELVGGFHTEYSSLKFAMFFLAEYINMVTVSALATTLFLGGWMAPWPLSLWSGANVGWWPLLWWLIKVQIFIFMFIWLRGTLPRMRYDQFMKFGWKLLIPISIAWILVVATAKALRNDVQLSNTEILAAGAIVIVILLLGSWIVQSRSDRREAAEAAELAAAQNAPFEPMAGGFPVPPMPGQQFTYTSRREMARGTTIVQERVITENGDDPASDVTTEPPSEDETSSEEGTDA